jgi:hypothetical protein
MWKERAESAERRVKVFERFTAKLRGIREAAAAADQRAEEEEEEEEGEGCNHDECNEEDGVSDGSASPNKRVRFLEGRRTKDWIGSDDSGKTEDAGVVTARIRKCLHGGQQQPQPQQTQAQDQGQVASPGNTMDGVMEHLHTRKYHNSNYNGHEISVLGRPARMEDGMMGLGAEEIWMAAEEFLDLDRMS